MDKVILLVEDEKGVIESYKELFRNKHKTLIAETAEDALDIIKKGSFGISVGEK